MEFGPQPTTWIFALDDRSTAMSLVETSSTTGPLFATPDSVDEVVATFPRSAGIPEDVAALLDMSRKLLRTSVIHYEFAAIGVEKSLQALELAVRIHLAAGRNVVFVKLIERLKAEGALPLEDVDLIDTARQLRNDLFAHPKTVMAFPLVMATNLIRTSHRLSTALFPS